MACHEFKPEAETVDIKSTNNWIPTDAPWCPVVFKKIERFFRVKLFGQPRYFIDQWTLSQAKDICVQHGIDVEEELAMMLKEEMRENGTCTWKELCDMDKDK